MNPRYFIGILLPDEMRNEVGKIQHELLQPGKIMEPLKPHITLLHPNMVMNISPMYLVPKIKELTNQILPISINLTHTGMFDMRVLHIVVDSPEITDLYSKLTSLLPEETLASYSVGRSFAPHVTVAQTKPKQTLSDEQIYQYQKRIDPLLPYVFQVNKLTIFKWIRPRVYKVLPI
jgi:2'-5' RNA ligase